MPGFASMSESNAPHRTRHSSTRLFTTFAEARREQKSMRPLYGPFFSRSSTIASAAAPTPFTPAMP